MENVEKEKLIINKDNYEGYLELYKTNFIASDDQQKNHIKAVKQALLFGCGSIFIVMISMPFWALGIISKPFLLTECFIGMGSLVLIGTNYYIKDKRFRKNKFNDIKEKYSYVDINVEIKELEESLMEAKIVERHNDTYYICDNDYKNYVEAEEVKKEYLEETKYDKYTIETEIPKVELEKPKIKKIGSR